MAAMLNKELYHNLTSYFYPNSAAVICLCTYINMVIFTTAARMSSNHVKGVEENSGTVELHISEGHCLEGWFQEQLQPQKTLSDDFQKSNIILCRKCTECKGVLMISACTNTSDTVCSKTCLNSDLTFHEVTRSCRYGFNVAGGHIEDDYFTADEYSQDPDPDFIDRQLLDIETEIKQLLDETKPEDEVKPKDSYKDPNVLFVASGVIFTVLLLMLIPQAGLKVRRWYYARQHPTTGMVS